MQQSKPILHWFWLLAAADLRIDATPMEGFDNKAVDELLDLPAQGLKSAVILALGYKDEDTDWWSRLDRVRRPRGVICEN